MPAESLGTPLLLLPCLRFPPLPLRTVVFCGNEIGMTRRSESLLECWEKNLKVDIVFRRVDGYLNLITATGKADYQEMAEVLQGLFARIVALKI